MKRLAYLRLGLGALAWVAPRTTNRIFGLPRSADSAALLYMNRVFGVRAIALGLGYLASEGEARRLWHRLWLLCDSADTAMGLAMVARGQLTGLTALEALALTGGSAAIDLAAMGTAGFEPAILTRSRTERTRPAYYRQSTWGVSGT